MFLFKKIFSRLFFPVPMCVEIFLAGLILLWFTRKQRAARIVVSVGVMLLLVFSITSSSDMLLKPLEREYPPLLLKPGGNIDPRLPPAGFIVVLAGGFASDPDVPVTSQLSEDTTVRLVEGIRLYRELPSYKLVLSGGAVFDPVPVAEVMGKVAQALGVNPQDIILESMSRDTEDEARLIKPVVGTNPFILVTSASHMPRSMALFRKLGMNPIAAPTDYLVTRHAKTNPDDFYPGTEGLLEAQRAVYEYLGLAWAKLRGRI